MRKMPAQFMLSLIALVFAILWHSGVWQRTSVIAIIFVATALSCIQITQDIRSRTHSRARVLSAWPILATRIAITIGLAALGVAVCLKGGYY